MFGFIRLKRNKPYQNKGLISVVMPVFKAEKTILNSLKSIQSQTYENIEIIIVEDAGNDGSLELLNHQAELDKRIILFSNSQNMGAAYSKNVGLHYAKGDYITFHDADDTSNSHRFDRQLSYLNSINKCVLSICKYERIDKHGKTLIMNGKRSMNYVSGMMFKKEMIERLGYFKPTQISEDSEYHERILAVYGKKRRKIINEVLYRAMFDSSSLLFSNANLEVNGNKVNYKINDNEFSVLSDFRAEHEKIIAGELTPYQGFEIDLDITKSHQ